MNNIKYLRPSRTKAGRLQELPHRQYRRRKAKPAVSARQTAVRPDWCCIYNKELWVRSRANAARRTGFSAAPSGGSAPPADSRTADVFFRSPNLRRLAGRRLRPELRVASRRPRLSRQRRSPARKTAASEVKLQYKRYGTQVRTGIRRRTAAASRNGLRRASGRVFPSASPCDAQKRGRRPIQPNMRALLPPMRRDDFAALSRPTARQADIARAAIYKRIKRTAILESLCVARSPRRKRNASSPRAITTGPTCHKNVYGDGSGRTAASLRQASRPARGGLRHFSADRAEAFRRTDIRKKHQKPCIARLLVWRRRSPPPGGAEPAKGGIAA